MRKSTLIPSLITACALLLPAGCDDKKADAKEEKKADAKKDEAKSDAKTDEAKKDGDGEEKADAKEEGGW